MKAPQSSFNSVEDLFKAVLKYEEYVTSCINELVGKAMESKDHITVRFLDWFIQEQLEELFNEILSKIKMLVNGKLKRRDLYTFDGIMADFDSKKHSTSSNEQ